jgi:hypothetical protein
VNREADLKTAIAYLIDLNAELDERGAVPTAGVHAGARADMLYQLRHAQRLAGALEGQAADVSCTSWLDGREVLIDLQLVKAWTLAVQARLVRVCGDGTAADARVQKAVSH